MFRNESSVLSSTLILEAIAATRAVWPDTQDLITFIDRSKVRRKRDFGRCYRRAGFTVAGETIGGLLALEMQVHQMPVAEMPHGMQGVL